MNKYQERRNIDLNKLNNYESENHSHADSKSHRSPHKPAISYKTEMKRSNSRLRYDGDGVDESLDGDQLNEQRFEHKRDYVNSSVQKPFSNHNWNDSENKYLGENNHKETAIAAQRSEQLKPPQESNGKDLENDAVGPYDFSKIDNQGLLSKNKKLGYKSQSNFQKSSARKSPSSEYLKIKSRIEKEMKASLQDPFKLKNQVSSSKLKKSPDPSLRQIRSNSPNFRFPLKQTTQESSMTAFRMKRLKNNQKQNYDSKKQEGKQIDEIWEFSDAKSKTGIVKPSIAQSKHEVGKSRTHTEMLLSAQKDQSETEKSLQKLKEKAS